MRLLHHCGLPVEDVDFINSDGRAMNRLLLEVSMILVLRKVFHASDSECFLCLNPYIISVRPEMTFCSMQMENMLMLSLGRISLCEGMFSIDLSHDVMMGLKAPKVDLIVKLIWK